MTPTDLRAVIEAMGVSQREMARRLGIGERTMREYLDRRRTTPVPRLVALAVATLASEHRALTANGFSG